MVSIQRIYLANQILIRVNDAMPFINENTLNGLPTNAPYQAGRSDVDRPNPVVEAGALLPWPSDPSTSWVYFECAVGVMLDSGIVVHNRLPQVNNLPDTLSAADINDPNYSMQTTTGVNLKCRDQYADIVQRMGHSRYWFRLWGQALRVGYKVPIPGIRVIGGVPTIPYDANPQWAYNRIFPGGNYSGVVLWHAEWSLWYTTAVPPNNNSIPALDVAARINGNITPPNGMQSPFSQPDDNSVPNKPNTRINPVVQQSTNNTTLYQGRLQIPNP